jgi:hypothetical protein
VVGTARPRVLSRWVTHAALVALVAAVLATPTSRASALPRAATAGSLTCASLTGTVSFSPPAVRGGTRPEVQRFSLIATRCTASAKGVRVTRATVTATVRRPTNSCAALFASAPATGTVTWSPRSITKSTFRFSGYSLAVSPTGQRGFSLPGPGGTARVTGSFAGADRGARSSAVGYLDLTASQFAAECASGSGLAHHRVVAGRARFA